jgi:hypothetical protein
MHFERERKSFVRKLLHAILDFFLKTKDGEIFLSHSGKLTRLPLKMGCKVYLV